jgi:HAD superfamily hydrolase (TIGR01509 family)
MFPLSRPPALVLFDCDGVLVDSEPISNIIFTEQLNIAGVKLDLIGMQQRYTGMSMPDIKIKVMDEFAIELDDAWHDRYRTLCDVAFKADLRPVPHIRDAVLAVKNAGIAYCVASSGPMEKMTTTLGITGLLPLFDGHMYTGWDVPKSKPHPDLFWFAADHYGAKYDGCIVIEDSLAGVRAGVAAGMPVLGYAPPSNMHDLTQEPAFLFDDMQALPGLLGLD